LHRLDRNEEALEAIRRAIDLAPQNADYWRVRADILRDMGRIQEAEEAEAKARGLADEH
jgi:tetratricopeptide (TPR) repeat protein